MDFIRELVGGPKHRYKQNGYNLDLTYITPRIIAMAFPASGVQKIYRNSIDSVSTFLLDSHHNKYMTVNLSGREIDSSKLQNVHKYTWEDHQAPALQTLFVICMEVAEFLAKDEQNVAVFHCNHGKGRTGTIICCFFLYLGIFQNCETAMKFYGEKRFQKEGQGVTQPCQIRYIQYFQACIKMFSSNVSQSKEIQLNKLVTLRKVTLSGSDFTDPYLKIYKGADEHDLMINTQSGSTVFQTHKPAEFMIRFNQTVSLCGDIIIEIKNHNKVGTNLLASFTFNTLFLEVGKALRVQKSDLAPLSLQKDVKQDFFMEIQFKPCCYPLSTSLCKPCKKLLLSNAKKLQIISVALKFRDGFQHNKRVICFGASN